MVCYHFFYVGVSESDLILLARHIIKDWIKQQESAKKQD